MKTQQFLTLSEYQIIIIQSLYLAYLTGTWFAFVWFVPFDILTSTYKHTSHEYPGLMTLIEVFTINPASVANQVSLFCYFLGFVLVNCTVLEYFELIIDM